MIKNVLGWLLLFEAVFLLLPALIALIYRESAGLSYLWTAAACAVVGMLLRLGKPKHTRLYSRDGFVIVALSWILISFFGALPLWLTREIPSLVDALFEAVSGFTTTGASILADVESLSHASLIWRSFANWIGGMGVLVFIMAFLPLSGGQNMHIMRVESPGPSVSKLVPRVRTTALLLYLIYIALTLLEFILLICCGMSVFEALNAAFATAGTGGFGIYNSGFADFAPRLQWIVAVFMVLFSINFASYFFLLQGKWREACTAEVRLFLGIILVSTGAITLQLVRASASVSEALRNAFFTVASVISSTGFATVDFDLWPALSKFILFTLMFVGACAGSTGGGIKISRILILAKGIARELRCALHPKQVKKISIDGKPVEEATVHSVFVYVVCLFAVYAASVLLISINGYDMTTNLSAAASMLNNTGPGFSLVGPTCNYGFFSNFSKLVLMFDMLAGRLELFAMLLLFHPATWKRH